MASPLIFFRKNAADYEYGASVVTASEDSGSTAQFVLDRSNRTGWGTTGSVDANNTTLVLAFNDTWSIDTVLLVNHNFASVKVEYWDPVGLAWVAVSTISSITVNVTRFSFAATVLTTQIRVTIFGTQVANSDKFLSQFIATSTIGQLSGWPVFTSPTLAKNLVQQQMLSGKSVILQNVGAYSTTLEVSNWSNSADLAIVETLYNISEGFLFWPCGGDQTQFRSVRQGYSLQDIFLCRCTNEFSPEWYQGFYQSGMAISMDLAEVIT